MAPILVGFSATKWRDRTPAVVAAQRVAPKPAKPARHQAPLAALTGGDCEMKTVVSAR